MKSTILGWFLLVLCYFIGNVLVLTFSLPIPGLLIGLVLLLLLLLIRGRDSANLTHSVQPLLKHMSLFFVPATLGVGLYWHLLWAHWLPLLLAIVVSTIISLSLSAKFNMFILKTERTDDAD